MANTKNPKYIMVVDAAKCMNCKACVVSCQMENGVTAGHSRNWIKTAPEGGAPLYFQPGNCMQCDQPSCVRACPVNATYKASDGRVLIDPKKCIACGNCVAGCPYGARHIHPRKKIADKCDFCSQRLKIGLEPACVVTCPTRARVFGDLNDPSSQASRLVNEKKDLVFIRNARVDTKPCIYYYPGVKPVNWPVAPTLPGGRFMPARFWLEDNRKYDRRAAGITD